MPDFLFSEFIVYVRDGVDIKAFVRSVQTAEEDIFDTILITHEYIATILDDMGGVFTAAAAGVLAITVFVIVLTLYMIIKTTILRRQRELGIQKAVGFTTWQLMNQIALNMTPVILAGVLTGSVAGCFGLNPLVAALMNGMGIAKVNLPAPLEQIIFVCIALVILAYAVSMLIAWRIRKISAYALINER
jgi:putative ABC transport system permease protein